MQIRSIWCFLGQSIPHIVDKPGEKLVDKLEKAKRSGYVSPYLRAPLRSLDEVLRTHGESAPRVPRAVATEPRGQRDELSGAAETAA